jgi:hypothetical protein
LGSCHQIDDTHLPQDTSNQGPLEVVVEAVQSNLSELWCILKVSQKKNLNWRTCTLPEMLSHLEK